MSNFVIQARKPCLHLVDALLNEAALLLKDRLALGERAVPLVEEPHGRR